MPPDRQTLAAIAEYTGGESFDAQSADEARGSTRASARASVVRTVPGK